MSSRIAVVGTGYVGLTTGACLSHLGHHVVCADVVAEKVERLNQGDVPILEAGLDDLVHEGLASGRLTFVLGARPAVADAEFVYLCVPTPQGEDGSADLSYLQAAAEEIGPHLLPEAVVINKSTVPVGSTRVVEQALGRTDVYVVSNPEFLREGTAVNDWLKPDRVVIGADDQNAAIRVGGLYHGLDAPIQVTDPASAETIKYASNAYLATKISFINAIAAVCEAVGADVNDVVLGMGYDKRIGNSALRPGPGWGGSCFTPGKTVLVRRDEEVRLLTFADLFAEVEVHGASGWEVLSWRNGDPSPEFFPVGRFTARPYTGEVVEVVTKMGRRVTVTADHPFVVSDGLDADRLDTVTAAGLTTDHWLPVAQGAPIPVGDPPAHTDVLGAALRLDLSISSRVLAAWLDDLGVGRDCYTKRIPDVVWSMSQRCKRALLRGLWDGDGSWSAVNRGPSVVLEYGTVSRDLADGMLRLFGDLGIVARLKVGRTRKSTVDTYWLTISGANQVERAGFLLPEDELIRIRARLLGLERRIEPTGYRRLSKNAAWVRVARTTRQPFDGVVYSLEVPAAHTVVTTHGLVADNCFPKDSRALVRIAEDAGYDFGLLKGVITVNDEQFERVTDKIVRRAGGSVDGVLLAVWGLTFKARTDDLRDSPALEIIRRLRAQGAVIRAFDPAIPVDHGDRRLDGIDVVADGYAACEGAEVLAILTEWDDFRWLDFDKVAGAMANPRVVDARNLLEKHELTRRGFEFEGIGRS